MRNQFMRHPALSVFGFAVLYLGTCVLLTPDHVYQWPPLLLTLPLIWLSLTDLARRIIPDTASAAVAGIGIVGWVNDPLALGLTLMVSGAVVIGLALSGGLYWRRRGHEALGLGDAKLIGAGILVVGIDAMWLMLLLGSIGGIASAVFAGRTGDGGVPFGPFLAYSIYITFLLTGSQ